MSETGSTQSRKPSAREVFSSPMLWLAYGFGTGLSPRAPGTFGSLVGIPLFWLMRGLDGPVFLVAALALFAAGCMICGRASAKLGVHDPGAIVFDEIVGQLLTCAPLLPAFGGRVDALGLLAAFALFRLFDIWKPWPIRLFDRRVGGGLGIMLDDAVAAILAAAALLGLRALGI